MKFEEVITRANDIRMKYDERNDTTNSGAWDASDIMSGLVGDIGDLSKLVQAHAGKRQIEDVDQQIKHELADCLWSIIVLAQKLDVDLESAFVETMDELESRFR